MANEPLKPSRELDALVAEKVMGLARIETLNSDGTWNAPLWALPTGGVMRELPRYSTDIAAAWEVVNRVRNTVGWNFAVIEDSAYEIGWWVAGWFDFREGPYEHEKSARGESAPHAICLAALKAVGVELAR